MAAFQTAVILALHSNSKFVRLLILLPYYEIWQLSTFSLKNLKT